MRPNDRLALADDSHACRIRVCLGATRKRPKAIAARIVESAFVLPLLRLDGRPPFIRICFYENHG